MPRISIDVDINSGPTSVEHGFTQAAVEVSVTNTHTVQRLRVDDLRLMFAREFGALVQENAPPGRKHPKLPYELAPQTTITWYFHAEELSALLAGYHKSPKPVKRREVQLHVQCILGTKKVVRGPWFMFTTDPDSHFLSPTKLHSLSNLERLLKVFRERWKYIGLASGVAVVVWRLFLMLRSTPLL